MLLLLSFSFCPAAAEQFVTVLNEIQIHCCMFDIYEVFMLLEINILQRTVRYVCRINYLLNIITQFLLSVDNIFFHERHAVKESPLCYTF